MTSYLVLSQILACMGPDAETLVDELRVMAIQAEPAEVQLRDFFPNEMGETTAPVLNVVVADPLQKGYQLAVWPCTNFGEGCEERALFEENPAAWISLVEGTDRMVTVPVIQNPLWAALLSQSPTPNVPLAITTIFALACEPSVCIDIQNALQGSWNLENFANPFDWMAALPVEGTSLAIKQLPLSNGDSEDTRLKNPLLIPAFDIDIPLTSTIETPLELPFEITIFQQDPDVASIFGYTSRGGFDRNVFANNGLNMNEREPAERSVTWYAGDAEAGAAELFVIVEDGAGGTGIWLGEGTLQ